MITLLSIATALPGREAEHLSNIREVWELTHAHEPGVVRYEHYRGQSPNQFFSLLVFRDFDAFLQHQLADYHHNRDWLGPLETQDFQILDPISGANDLEPTQVPALESHVDELRQFYAAMLPGHRPQWWDEEEPVAA